MITITYRKLKMAAVMFAAAPILMFFFTWLNLLSALGFSALLIAAVYFSFCHIRNTDGEKTEFTLSAGAFAAIAFLALLWCLLAGQGAFVHQTSDHVIRNQIITDLTLRPWPVIYEGDDVMLCYYITYWMIPCAAGKLALLTGSENLALHVSNFALFLQSAVGVFIALLLVVLLTQKKGRSYVILAVLMFIFFSGMDVIGTMITTPEHADKIMKDDHIEWWALDFQYSSVTTCLYWVYNQTVPVWPLAMCLFNELSMKDFALLALLVFPFAPFPFVGLVLFCLLRAAIMLAGAFRRKTIGKELRVMLSPQNFLICFAVAPVFITYFTANVMVADTSAPSEENVYGTGFRLLDDIFQKVLGNEDPELRGWLIWLYFAFIILEAGVFTVLLLVHYKERSRRMLIIGNMVLLTLIPLFQLGTAFDFCMRASIPEILFICILMIRFVIEDIPEKGETPNLDAFARKRTALLIACLVLSLGAATPIMEITREIMYTVRTFYPDPMLEEEWSKFDYDDPASLETMEKESNFFAHSYQDSSFYRFFCKH